MLAKRRLVFGSLGCKAAADIRQAGIRTASRLMASFRIFRTTEDRSCRELKTFLSLLSVHQLGLSEMCRRTLLISKFNTHLMAILSVR